MQYAPSSNRDIAKMLQEISDLLEIQHADPHRVRAYRRAAAIILKRPERLSEAVAKGDGEALEAIPGIGQSLARTIEEYLKTGKSQLLQRLKGEVSPEEVFEQVPGIGPDLAKRIVSTLGIKSLEELEQAAHDGRLSKVSGFGKKRVEAIRISLGSMLSSFIRRSLQKTFGDNTEKNTLPAVPTLLAVDEDYRRKAAAGDLKKIAPKRFNPEKTAWLPVWHTRAKGWEFTALFSNTERAHTLHKTNDWVVIYFEKNGREDQVTVVTETSGPLAGLRVVRGQEEDCANYYRKLQKAASLH